MKKVFLRSLIASVFLLTTTYSMDSSPLSPMDSLPCEMQLQILKSQDNRGQIILNSSDVVKLLMVNKIFSILAKDSQLWVLLGQKDGFETHPNTAFKSHTNYLKGMNYKNMSPDYLNQDALQGMLLTFNKSASFMHKGAIEELIAIMDSPNVSLDTKCIYLPEELNLNTCALLSDDELLNKTDDEFVQLLGEHVYIYPIMKSTDLRERFFEILDKRGLKYMSQTLRVIIEGHKNEDDCHRLRELMFSDFEGKKPQILCILDKAMMDRDFTTIDLIVFLFNAALGSSEGSGDSSDSEDESNSCTDLFDVIPILEDIKRYVAVNVSHADIAKMSRYLDFLDNETKTEDENSPNSPLFLSILKSGHVTPHILEKAEFILEEPYDDYLYFLNKQIGLKYPALCFYQNKNGKLNSIYFMNDDRDGSPLTLRTFLELLELAKIDCGDRVNIPLVKELTGLNLPYNISPEFCQKYCGFDNFVLFQEHLLKTSQQKLLRLLMYITDKEDMFEICEFLSQSYTHFGDHESALKYAAQVYEMKSDDLKFARAYVHALIKMKQFEKAIEIATSSGDDDMRQQTENLIRDSQEG